MKYPLIQNYIAGGFTAPSSSKTMDVVSPVDGTLLSKVPLSSATDLNTAVAAAKKAFPAWSKTPIKERVQVFFQIQNPTGKKS